MISKCISSEALNFKKLAPQNTSQNLASNINGLAEDQLGDHGIAPTNSSGQS